MNAKTCFTLFALLLSGCELGSFSQGRDSAGAPPSDETIGKAAEIAPAATAAAQGSARFDALVASGAADPIAALEAELRANPDVAHVERSEDGASVLVTSKSGATVAVLTDEKDRAEWTASNFGAASGALEDDGAVVCDPATYPTAKTACLIGAFAGEFQQDLGPLKASLTRTGYQPKTLSLKTVADVVALRAALPSCGVVYLSTHGAVSKAFDGTRSTVIATEIALAGDAKAPGFAQDLQGFTESFGGDVTSYLGAMGHKGKAYWALTPAFFASVKYPNSLVVVDACHSARQPAGGAGLAAAFRGHGAGAFLGWSGAVSTRFSNPAVDALFTGLAPKTAGLAGITLSTDPPDPTAGQAYVPSASVSPAAAGIELRLSVSGTDGYTTSSTQLTDAAGAATFTTVPGGAEGVVDTLTLVAGGAGSTSSVLNVVQSDPALQKVFTLPYNPATETKASFVPDAATGFNLVCANEKATKTTTIVKF